MVDYGEALKRPFSNISKLVLAIILSIFPIVNFIYTGYILEVARSAMKHKSQLPEWKGIGQMFVRGFMSFIISLVYALPVIVTVIILVVLGILIGIAGSTNLALLAILFLVVLIVLFVVLTIAVVMIIGATLRFAETYKFSSAFEFSFIFKKMFRGKFIGPLVLISLIAWAISFGFSMLSLVITNVMPVAETAYMTHLLLTMSITMIISAFGGVISSIFMYTALGQAYVEK